MVETRYGEQVAEARRAFVNAVSEGAGKIVAVFTEHPLRGGTPPYQLGAVLAGLTAGWDDVLQAVRDYPLAVAVDSEGRPDKLGQEVARLAVAASHVASMSDVPLGEQEQRLVARCSASQARVVLVRDLADRPPADRDRRQRARARPRCLNPAGFLGNAPSR